MNFESIRQSVNYGKCIFFPDELVKIPFDQNYYTYCTKTICLIPTGANSNTNMLFTLK